HHEGELVPGEGRRHELDQGADRVAERPVGDQAEYDVRSSTAEGARGGGRGVAKLLGRVVHPLSGGVRDGLVWCVVEDVAHRRAGHAGLAGDIRAGDPSARWRHLVLRSDTAGLLSNSLIAVTLP